ncbi:MAG: glycosyltransferase family 39 protein [Desulfobacterales bacterium]|nr:glycosyltransferase family 39 protein [Desulfobacterales bacterium]
MHSTVKEHSGLLFFLAGITLLRLLVIPRFGLGVDEAHYVLYGRYLDLSYFDHPPLIGWVQYVFTSLFGENEFGARIAAVLIGGIVSVLIYRFILAIARDRYQALFCTVALNASFLFNALFIMLMPDTLLFILIIPLIHTVIAVEQENTVGNWLRLGLLLGLAGLAKYTAVLFLPPIALYFIFRRRFDLLFTPKLLPGALLALLLISPVLVWNARHDWISFAYQARHVAGSDAVSWGKFGLSLGAQFVAYSPLLLPIAFFGLYKALRSKEKTLFLSALFGVVLIGFFTYASFYERALPHWTSPFYLLFIPIGSYYLLQAGSGWKKYLYGAVAISMTLSLLAYGELSLKLIPFKDYQATIHRDIYGFDTIMEEAAALIDDPAREAMAVTNWTLASRAIFYNPSPEIDLFLIDNRDDQFDLWQKSSPIGRDLLFINTHFFNKDINATMRCSAVEQAKTIDIYLHNKVNSVDYVWCRNFQGLR